MLKRLLSFLGSHGEDAKTHTHKPETKKEKSEYEKLCDRIRAADGDRYFLSRDEFQVLSDCAKSDEIRSLDFSYRTRITSFILSPYRRNLTLFDKQLIPDGHMKAEKQARGITTNEKLNENNFNRCVVNFFWRKC